MKIEDMQLTQRLKAHIFKFDFTMFIALVLLLVTSCDSSDDNEDSVNLHNTNLEQKLFNTTWKRTKHIITGKVYTNIVDNLTFTNRTTPPMDAWYIINLKGQDFGFWYINGEQLFIQWDASKNANLAGNYSASYGGGALDIIKLTNTELQYKRKSGDSFFYELIGTSSEEENDNETTIYEKPDVGFYDFTATKSSLKVQYKIYNKNDAKVTSAKIYYGTSRNPTKSKTATISGTLITANISGLKAGTTYYVKCTATGKGGITTTTTTKCITNY
jgi:hypothetical protein